MKEKNLESLGRFLSFVLRHHPESIGIELDEHGYAQVTELLAAMKAAKKEITISTLETIVATNHKKRYSFNEDHTKIRANQGHSIDVDVELEKRIPPDILYHGTAARFLESIHKEGLTAQSRLYVHLSSDGKTALEVGKRHGKPVILKIDAKKMTEDKIDFYFSKNGVWLCKKVPVKYICFDEKKGSFL